jgi:hypothetical protein
MKITYNLIQCFAKVPTKFLLQNHKMNATASTTATLNAMNTNAMEPFFFWELRSIAELFLLAAISTGKFLGVKGKICVNQHNLFETMSKLVPIDSSSEQHEKQFTSLKSTDLCARVNRN